MRLFFILIIGVFSASLSRGQDTLFYENFEGTTHSLNLNTADLGGVSGSSGYNFWTVNNSYTGGSGTFVCLGFPFTFVVPNTQLQPAGISGFPGSTYLHVLANQALNQNITNSNFAPADGLCVLAESNFSGMSSDINTSGRSNVTLKFWWLCGGGTAIHGELLYSTNSGTSWTQVTAPIAQYKNQTTWVQQTVSLPVFNGQNTLRFGWRFSNSTSNTALDPGFSVDDIVITADPVFSFGIDTTSSLAFCPGDPITVTGSSNGSALAGNVFTLELSDASGNFTSPVNIGTLSDTTFSAITGTIPPGTGAGSGYRVRITSSNPSLTSADNGFDLTVNPASVAGSVAAVTDTLCQGDSTTISVTGSAGVAAWEYSTDGGTTWTAAGISGNSGSSGPLMANTWFRAIVTNNPCDGDTSGAVLVSVVAPPEGGTLSVTPDSICPGDAVSLTLTNASGGSLNWASSTDGTNFNPIAGATGTNYNSGPLSQNTWYQVTVSNGYCPDAISSMAEVTVVPQPVATFSQIQNGLTVDFTDQSTGAVTWLWNFGDGNLSTMQNPSHTYAANGSYTVTLIVENSIGCSDTLTDSVSVILGLADGLNHPVIQLFPNPANHQLQIRSFTPERLEVDIYSVRGQWISHEVIVPYEETILDVSNFPSGIYLLIGRTPNHQPFNTKFQVIH